MGRSGEIIAGSGRLGDTLAGRYPHMLEPGFEHLHFNRIFFLLCNSCYWCASEIGGVGIRKCPSCKHAVEPVPIVEGERFRFDYDPSRGVHLAFRRS